MLSIFMWGCPVGVREIEGELDCYKSFGMLSPNAMENIQKDITQEEQMDVRGLLARATEVHVL
jgi:hypothetical protein